MRLFSELGRLIDESRHMSKVLCRGERYHENLRCSSWLDSGLVRCCRILSHGAWGKAWLRPLGLLCLDQVNRRIFSAGGGGVASKIRNWEETLAFHVVKNYCFDSLRSCTSGICLCI